MVAGTQSRTFFDTVKGFLEPAAIRDQDQPKLTVCERIGLWATNLMHTTFAYEACSRCLHFTDAVDPGGTGKQELET